MATDYQFVVLTDADKLPVIQGELRSVEDQLYRARIIGPSFGDTSALLERAEFLKTELAKVTATK